ncbi:MAG TPA: hypothetical protein VFK03_03075 [Candidatus Saccharimonadales bacterium]|nr:hypothetical protein [Candidatus Saccharimonadales bacterium]
MSLLSDIGGFLGDLKDEAGEISQPIKALKDDLTDDYAQAKRGLTEPISEVSDAVRDLGKDA